MPDNPVIGEHHLLLPPNPLQFHALDSIQHMPSLKYEIQLNEFVARFQMVFCELCPAEKITDVIVWGYVITSHWIDCQGLKQEV